MGSVTSTFGALIPEKTVPGTRGTEGRFEQAPRAFINLIRKVFQENLPAVKAPAIAASGIMRLQVPILDLFSRGDDRIRPRSRPLLGGIADGLALQNDEWRFEVEVVLGTGAALPSGSSVGANLEVRRAGAFARYLRAIGVPAHSVRTGLRAGDREVVQLSFYIRDVKQARLNLQVNGQ